MRHKKKGHDEGHADESWLLPYSDMMTLLLALFIVMFASSSVDQEKLNAMAESMFTAFGGTSHVGRPYDPGQIDFATMDPSEIAQILTFADLYTALTDAVDENGYENIEVIDGGDYITVRFSEAALFMPNMSAMTNEGNLALETIGTILMNLHQLIGHIQIEGHTAFIGEEADRTMEAWKLSSDRAIVVLEYLTRNLGYEQAKMNTAGFSHFVPVASNDTEAGRARNRRVELRITPEIASSSSIVSAIQDSESASEGEASEGEASEGESSGSEATESEPESQS